MKTVLVTAASKHGATTEIAERIAETLSSFGLDVSVDAPGNATAVGSFDAFVIGSGVYVGHWLSEAKDFIDRHKDELAARDVWLFSSGPIGEPPKPEEEPVDVSALIDATKAREHRLFTGRLERKRLGFAEKAVVIALRAPEGDFRDWDAIEAWAREIASALRA